jgi:hypothetical protein
LIVSAASIRPTDPQARDAPMTFPGAVRRGQEWNADPAMIVSNPILVPPIRGWIVSRVWIASPAPTGKAWIVCQGRADRSFQDRPAVTCRATRRRAATPSEDRVAPRSLIDCVISLAGQPISSQVATGLASDLASGRRCDPSPNPTQAVSPL